jgi:uncharacterized membrane protein
MSPESEHETILDDILSFILRMGLLLSLLTVLIGAALFLYQHSKEEISHHVFIGEPSFLKGISGIFEAAMQDKTLAIIQLGVILLIITPLLRVFSCLIVFVIKRDYLYIGLSTFVLGILLYSLLFPME